MTRFAILLSVLLGGGLWFSGTGRAFSVQERPPLLKAFLDCDQVCDFEFLRQNVTFVDYVRDRAVADVHVLVTTEPTGGGGMRWSIKFIGIGRFDGQDRTLTFTSLSAATGDENRREFARLFGLGLVGYAADTPVASRLSVVVKPSEETSPATGGQKDPWDYWVLHFNINGNMNGEQSSKTSSTSFSFNADRTTNEWKINLSTDASISTNSFTLDDATTIHNRTHSWDFNALTVKSLGPKWSYGSTASVSHSSFSNIDRSYNVAPGIEYNFFPYSESASRRLSVRYTAGPVRYQYAELTIFDKREETVFRHFLTTSVSLRQQWGSFGVTSTFSQQVDHLDRYHEAIFANADVRLFKGFSFNMFGGYDRIADQLSLRKDVASESDVLLRILQLKTNYSYYLNFGVSYSIGSIYNSIVNSRF